MSHFYARQQAGQVRVRTYLQANGKPLPGFISTLVWPLSMWEKETCTLLHTLLRVLAKHHFPQPELLSLWDFYESKSEISMHCHCTMREREIGHSWQIHNNYTQHKTRLKFPQRHGCHTLVKRYKQEHSPQRELWKRKTGNHALLAT